MTTIPKEAVEHLSGYAAGQEAMRKAAAHLCDDEAKSLLREIGPKAGIGSRLNRAAAASLVEIGTDIRALPIQPAPSPWQPIETAPKDGTWILAWRAPERGLRGQNGVWVRWYEDEDSDASWYWPDDTYDVFTVDGAAAANAMIEDGACYRDARFTHWMPLPAPPEAV